MKCLKRYLVANRISELARLDHNRAFGSAVCSDVKRFKLYTRRSKSRYELYRKIKYNWQ